MEKEMIDLAAICCVRMSSERLPGKALSIYDEASGKPNVQSIVERALTSRHSPTIVVATSTEVSDDPIEDWYNKSGIEKSGVKLFRGSLENVVSRMDGAIHKFCKNSNYIWRIMADCPLVDIGIIDWKTDVLSRNDLDALTAIEPEPTYAAQPSVWSRSAWDYCAKMSSGSLLSHPGEFIWENLHQFRTVSDIGPESIYYQPIRTELDTKEDLEFFKAIWKEWTRWEGTSISSYDPIDTKWALNLVSAHPEISKLNSHIQEKTHTTQLHGHHRARRVKCENPNCDCVIGYKVNDAFEMDCPRCGTTRKIYV